MDLLTLSIIAGIVVVIILIGFVGIPYLKTKGALTKQGTEATMTLLNIASVVLKNLNINDQTKSNVDTIFGVTQKVVQYVEQTMSDSDNATKKQYAVDATKEILGQLKIVLNSDSEKLIEIGIESAVNALPNTIVFNKIIQPTTNNVTGVSDIAKAISEGIKKNITNTQ
jgi:hypothetical protein